MTTPTPAAEPTFGATESLTDRTDTVYMQHPKIAGVATEVTRAAFDTIHVHKGWEVVGAEKVAELDELQARLDSTDVTALKADDLTADELATLAGRRGVEVKPNMSKGQIVKALQDAAKAGTIPAVAAVPGGVAGS